ncbi:MAG: hypothetical protein CMG66_03700 [Candidatus Marinimicrobia bacterium]|nr:hypothetical protein [Candidatus Neomarinimicrobiota bacterium]
MNQIILNNVIKIIFFSLLLSDQTDKMINSLIKGKGIYSFDQMKSYAENKSLKKDNKFILQGLLEIKGEKSVSYFETYIENNQEGPYSALALSKIADYYYTEGLYTKSSQSYQRLLFNFNDIENVVPTINYFINSLSVSGNLDSAKYYTELLNEKYPKLNFNQNFYSQNNSLEDTRLKKNSSNVSEGNYYVQIGLYKRYSDATYNRSILLSSGFLSRIDEILLDGNNKMYALRVGYYSDIKKAENIKRRIRSRLGLTELEIIELR